MVNRSQNGNVCDFKHQPIGYRGSNFYIPSIGYWFFKCNKFSTAKDYKQEILDFIRNEDRSNFTTVACIQPYLCKLVVNLGY